MNQAFTHSMLPFARIFMCLAICASMAACAKAPPRTDVEAYAEYKLANDPAEPLNKAVFKFNMALDKAITRPIAKTYNKVVPAGGRRSVTNFVDNLMHPLTFANDILQGQPKRAGVTFARFVINSTIGIAGLFDPAAKWGLEKHTEDIGQTLAVWGVPDGPYVMLPFFGGRNLRDTTGFVTEFFVDPVSIGIDHANVGNLFGTDYSALSLARRGLDSLDFRATNDAVFDELHASPDAYAVARSATRQLRIFEISNGELVESEEEEDIFDDAFEDEEDEGPPR